MSRTRVIVLLAVVSSALVLAALTPAPDPAAVFPTSFPIELGSSLALSAVYLSSLLLAGQRWLGPVLAERSLGRGCDRVFVLTAAAVCMSAIVLVPIEAVRIVGGSATDLLRPDVWVRGVVPEAWASLAMSLGGVVALLLSMSLRGRADKVASAVLPLVVVLAPTWLGHSRTEAPRAVMVGADVVHLVAAACWVSGVVVLAILVSTGVRRGLPAERVADAIVRFSVVARVATLAVVATGVIMIVIVSDQPGDIISTGWGRALLLKTALVGVAVAAARWNERRLSAQVATGADEAARWRIVRTVASCEAVLLIVVVGLSGFVTQMSP